MDSIDVAELGNLKEIMEDEFELLISMYLEDTAAQIQKMQEAVKNNDMETLKVVSHTLKGSSSNMFVTGISELSKNIEQKVKDNDLTSVAKLLPELAEELQIVKPLLENF